MQHVITLTCLVVEESDLNWLAAQPNMQNVQVAELKQAVKSETLAKAATNLVTNYIQHIRKKVDATYSRFNSLGCGGIRSQLAYCTAKYPQCASHITQIRLWKVRTWPMQPQT
jgi:hypothetical protein